MGSINGVNWELKLSCFISSWLAVAGDTGVIHSVTGRIHLWPALVFFHVQVFGDICVFQCRMMAMRRFVCLLVAVCGVLVAAKPYDKVSYHILHRFNSAYRSDNSHWLGSYNNIIHYDNSSSSPHPRLLETVHSNFCLIQHTKCCISSSEGLC